MRAVLAIALVASLVLAGCAGLAPTDGSEPADTGTTTTDTPATTTETTAPETTAAQPTTRDDSLGPDLGIDVMNGPLPFDPNVTYARVQTMLGTNQSPPGAVMVIEGMNAAGSASNTGRVFLDTRSEAVLAHEFTHSILLRAYPSPAVSSPDAEFAVNSLVEGAAEYTEAAYATEYLDGDPGIFRKLPNRPGQAYFIGRYYFGYHYFDKRADSVEDVTAIYETPPNTSEQVLHGLAPTEEPPRPFAISIDDEHLSSDADWRYTGRDRLGEFATFVTLRTRLSTLDASAAASGWGNDAMVTFANETEQGFVWVFRWDDEGNATEFVEAANEFADAPAPDYRPPTDAQNTPNAEFTAQVWTESDATVEVRRVAPELTVMVVGSDGFVDAANVTGQGANVSVGVG